MLFWSEQEIQVLKENYGRIKLSDLVLLLPGRTKRGINWQARKYNLYADRSITNSTYTHNQNFFSVANPVNSYWAGFIGADGCIDAKRNCLYLYQAERKQIEKFCCSLQYTGNIHHRVRSNGSHEYSVCVNSKQLVNDLLVNFNICQNKTKVLNPPSLTGLEALCYIVGYLDGDGHISITLDKRRMKHNIMFGILGTLSLTEWIRDSLNHNLIVRQRKDCVSPLFQVVGTGRKAVVVLNRLYDIEAIREHRMNRKWDKVKKWNDEYKLDLPPK